MLFLFFPLIQLLLCGIVGWQISPDELRIVDLGGGPVLGGHAPWRDGFSRHHLGEAQGVGPPLRPPNDHVHRTDGADVSGGSPQHP